jgi:hypothetical protein
LHQADGKRNGSSRPADECPWPRPFPAEFDKCPAYLQLHFIPIDTSYRPLPLVLTCRHLVTRPLNDQKSGWYGACDIGDRAARRRWVAEIDGGWLQELAQLQQQMEVINRPFIEKIWAAKALQLAAEQQGASVEAATAALQLVANAFLAESSTFLMLHRTQLEHLELPADAVLLLLRRSLATFVTLESAQPRWEIPDDVLEEFPDRVRAFFRPRRSNGFGAAPGPPSTDASRGELRPNS